MKKVKYQIRSLSCIVAVALLTLVGVLPASATQTIRELFDNITPVSAPIDGVTNDFTSVGLSTGFWTNHPAGGNGIVYKDSWSVNWVLQGLQGNILTDSGTGANGCLNDSTGNLNTLIDPDTGLAYGQWSAKVWATHPLDPSAYIDCNANGTYYFSVRIEKNYSWSAGDSSAGLGFSTGGGTNDNFVGIGVTRPGTLDENSNDIGDTDYTTWGTLGQAGITGEDDTGGPYLPRGHGMAQLYNSGVGAVNWAEAGLVIGKLVTTSGGACTLSVFAMLPNATLISNEVDVVWDWTTNFTETATMTHLLVWAHGPNVEYDAIRVGTDYRDVVGLETVDGPVATPSATVYAGEDVTLLEYCGVNSGMFPMTYQWLSNSVALDPTATNASYLLTPTTTNFTADYTVAVSNYYGIITSAVTHVTFLPTTAVFIVTSPVSITRYLAAPAGETFTVGVNGTPPYTYQWKHNGVNIGSPTTTSATANTLVVPGPTALSDGGSYYCAVLNNYGSANSATATCTVIQPAPGTFAGAITNLNPWGYWRLDDDVLGTGDTRIQDNWGANDGVAVNTNTPIFLATASPYLGFPQPHKGIHVGQNGNGYPCRVDLPKPLPCWTNNMTIVMWVDGAAQMGPMNGYGNGYGLNNSSGELVFDWPYFGAPSGGGGWHTGLIQPASGATFVAIVIQPTEAAVYMGTSPITPLVGADTMDTYGVITLDTSDFLNDTAGLVAPGLGRMQWPWSEGGAGVCWTTLDGTWSDVAFFNYTLSTSDVTNLFLSGVGMQINATPDGLGNLSLNWMPGFTLQEASLVTGPWTDVSGSPTPPYSVPISTAAGAQKYYRLRQ